MSSNTWALSQTSAAVAKPSLLRIYVNETRFDFLKMLRLPIYSASTILFPAMFYLLFGIVFGTQQVGHGIRQSQYLLASYTAFGVIGASLFSFGVGVATERGQGWLQVKRASPMPPSAYLIAKMITCMAFSVVVAVLLMLMGVTMGHVQLSAEKIVGLIAVSAFGSIPFCALGLAIAYFVGPNSAPAVVNLLYLPLSFCSGLWMPITMLPSFFQKAAPFLPLYHLGQLALTATGFKSGSVVVHVLALALSGVAGAMLAWYGFQRDEQKTYG
jgi:ABC-2 type transport system permease protein